jgi:hypothetical protein
MAPFTPQQNLVAERGNCTTTEKARAMLHQARLPLRFWGHGVETVVFLENVTPTRKKEWKLAYQLWFGRNFDKSCLQPFGCQAYIKIPKSKQLYKLGKTAKKGVLIGFQLGMHNWRILREEEQVELSHNVTFDKTQYPGISMFDPAGLLNPPLEEVFEIEEYVQTPSAPIKAENSDSSNDSDASVEQALQYHEAPLGSPEREDPGPLTQARQGYNIVLQPVNQKAPKDLSLAIDEGNIFTSKRRAHISIAIVDDDYDFHVQAFHAGVQFFNQTS